VAAWSCMQLARYGVKPACGRRRGMSGRGCRTSRPRQDSVPQHAYLCPSLSLGARLEQRLHHLRVPRLRREQQRRVAILSGQQRPRGLCEVAARR
jgi:hypothetical protein